MTAGFQEVILMYKELNENTINTCTQIASGHRGKAFLILNPEEPLEKGVVLETRGKLFAIADKDGLNQLYKASRKLEDQGTETMVDTIPLLTDIDTFTD